MNRRLITGTAGILCLCVAVAGCSCSELAPSEVRTNETQAMLTADQAKRAILELIRSHPTAFIGSPDPHTLQKLSLEERGEGKYAFGAFVVDVPNQSYSADIGYDAPELYMYKGDFVSRDGHWIASEPEVTRLHQLPE